MPLRLLLLALVIGVIVPSAAAQPPAALPTAKEMAAARTDVWGEAALREPGGPSYEFFRDLLPPLRYVNTEFRHYPIILAAPAAPVKARWISNGSGINLRAYKPPMWREVGTPVAFFVGEKDDPFGADPDLLTGPHYDESYLPVVTVDYKSAGVTYQQRAFAAVRPALAQHGAVVVAFNASGAGRIVARIGEGEKYTTAGGQVLDAKGRTFIRYGPEWRWNAEKGELTAKMDARTIAELLVFTKLAEGLENELPGFDKEGTLFRRAWAELLDRGVVVDVPEPLVQSAWRALVIGNYMIAVGDRMNYSAGNAYDHLYEGECGDAVRSLMLFGQVKDARRMIGPLLDFDRKATRFHVAGHKLQLLTHYYWVTRDKEYIEDTRAKWEPVVSFIRASRKTDNGLLPKDNYAGDVNTQVYSLSSNANCWRGLRDMAAVLDDVGDKDKAAELLKEANAFRKAILDAVAKSVRTNEKFVPIALLADEPAHDPLTATRQGSYYDLMIPYVLGSGVFGPGDEREGWIIDYLRNHGGIAMGMIRSMPHQGEFNNEPGVNVLYGLRYNLTLLRRGDRDHALVGFYGHLAQGMTRDTFVGGEGSRFLHGDKHGRSFYLPPNSASNATFLTTLRSLLIQDWDLDDDGKPETLRLLDAIPPRWLVDGKEIRVQKAPSAFGEIHLVVKPQLKDGIVSVRFHSPVTREIDAITVRLPDPPGYVITGATMGDLALKRDGEGRVRLPAKVLTGEVTFQVKPRT
jgi:hypothetical protein